MNYLLSFQSLYWGGEIGLVFFLFFFFFNTNIDVMVTFQEVLMMLDNYVRDFKALIDWIQLQEKLEKADAQSR